MKESGKDRLKYAVNESTLSTADAVPPSPMGKAKRRRLCRPKRKPTPPRCARQPLPKEGARADTPSFLWKEVPRRGEGWMGKAVSPTQSLPLPQTITPCGTTVNENGFLLSLGWRRRHSSFPIGRLSPLSKLFWSPLLNHILSRAYAP